MRFKSLIWVLGIVLTLASAIPAKAESRVGYRYYFDKGLKAFEKHEEQKAIRYFTIARIYDPSSQDAAHYLNVLRQKGVVLKVTPSKVPPDQRIGYRYYLKEGLKALYLNHRALAERYFKIALIFNPASKQAAYYLRLFNTAKKQPVPRVPAVSVLPVIPTTPTVSVAPVKPTVAAVLAPQISPLPSPAHKETKNPSRNITVPTKPPSGPVPVLLLQDIMNAGHGKPILQIRMGSAVAIQGQQISHFLVINDHFIAVKTIGPNRIEVDATQVGDTFLHIWDDQGRHTIYVEVLLPKAWNSMETIHAPGAIEHAQPFRVSYANDWSTYYQGPNAKGLQRESLDFLQTVGVTGATPYGFLDASGTFSKFDGYSQVSAYTLGLSQIPVPGTSDLNLRLFDAERYLSPLTMPPTHLRGVFADVDLMNVLGLSFSHGQKQSAFGFVPLGSQAFGDSYVDAFQITLLPKSQVNQLSFNFAQGYGADREPYLTKHVYSVEGQHKFNPNLTLKAEEARDDKHNAAWAGLQWQDSRLRTALNFHNINKDFTTISGLPTNQGEVGATWTTNASYQKFDADTALDVYRDKLYFNPNNPNALNYDANLRLHSNFSENAWSDTSGYYVNTPGELSPRRSIDIDERLSRNVLVWHHRRATVYMGGGYQDSTYTYSPSSGYQRESATAGLQVPLSENFSSFANDEYSWLNEPFFSEHSNPNVFNTGLTYNKQFNTKVSMNAQAVYRNESGVKGTSSFLAGEDSVGLSADLAYSPKPGLDFFADGQARKVWSKFQDNYDDLEIRLGVRLVFGGSVYWDPLGTVDGIVFKDSNGDGHFDDGEQGLAGIEVKVGNKHVVTNQQGWYRLKIRAKSVMVTPLMQSLPPGFMLSTASFARAAIIQGQTTRVDFGLVSRTGIYGVVFIDANANHRPDDNERLLHRIKIVLDGRLTQTTGAEGSYSFRNVKPGQHTITIDLSSVPLDMIPLIKLKNNINVSEGTTYMFNVPMKAKPSQNS